MQGRRMGRVLGVVMAVTLAMAQAAAGELRILLDDSTEMPLAEIIRGQVVRGVHFDIGTMLATELAQAPVFVVRPRKRILPALVAGEADVLCDYHPDWLPGPLGWTRPVLTHTDVLVTPLHQPRIRTVAELANQPVGTVLGFRYPEIEQVLGSAFRRDDAPQSLANLRKLAAGRMPYAVINNEYLDYQIKRGVFTTPLHPRLVISRVQTRCAVSPQGRLPLAAVDAALGRLAKQGKLATVYARYR